MTTYIEAKAVPGLLRGAKMVFLQGASGEPVELMRALEAEPDAAAGAHFAGVLVPSINRSNPAALDPSTRFSTTFMFGEISRAFAAGRVDFAPLHYSGTTEYFRGLGPYDAALIQISPPDQDGNCSLGVSVDFVPPILPDCGRVIAEMNEQMPAPPGSPKIPLSRVDYALRTDRPLIELDVGTMPAELETIAGHVADLIDDGDCVQVGIGKLPAAILRRLTDKRDLGLHGGMITDEIMTLAELGAMSGAKKTIDQGMMVCGTAFGSQRLYQWCGARNDIQFRPASYTHDPRIVARIDNFVSINSVLEIDLLCQANAEVINGRQISGTGGLVDFIRSARMAAGGRSILALTATAGRQKKSKIVAKLPAGTVVSGLRADVDYVVTEYGTARLKDKPVDGRAEALIAVAAPEAREDLADAWHEIRRAMAPD